MDKILLESPCLPVRLYGSFLCVLYHMVQKDFTRGLASASVLTFLLRLQFPPPMPSFGYYLLTSENCLVAISS